MLTRPPVLLLCCLGLVQAQTVTFHDGRKRRVQELTYEQDRVDTAQGEGIHRDEIREIFLGGDAPEAAGDAPKKADEDVKSIVEQGKKLRRKYGREGGCMMATTFTSILRGDRTQVDRYHMRGLVLKSTRGWADLSVTFDPKRERIRLLYARAIRRDGHVVEVGPDAAKVTVPTDRSRFFWRHRRFTLRLPEVSNGWIVDYCYEKEQREPIDPILFRPHFQLQGTTPVVHAKFTVIVPKRRKVYYRSRNLPAGKDQPTITHDKKTTSYVWELHDAKPLLPEPRMPPRTTLMPNVWCSLSERWDRLYEWMERLLERRMVVTPEIEAMVADVTAGCRDKEEMVARLYHYVQQRIRYISIKGSLGSSVAGHPAGLTLENRYGDCIDKAILFGAMLKAVGVESEPVFLMTNNSGEVDRTLPGLWANHAVSHVNLDGRSFYLDSTSTTFRYPSMSPRSHGVYAVNSLRRKVDFIDVPPSEMNCEDRAYTVTVSPDGSAQVEHRFRSVGDVEAGSRRFYQRKTEAERGRALTGGLSKVFPRSLLDRFHMTDPHDLSTPFSYRVWHSVPNYADRAGDLLIVPLPFTEWRFPDATLPTRKHAIAHRTSWMRVDRVTFRLPRSWRVRHLPKGADLTNPCATYQSHYSHCELSEVAFVSAFRRLKRVFPAHDYDSFRSLCHGIAKSRRQRLFLGAKMP